MSPFAEFPLLTIFVVLVLIVVLSSVFSPRKVKPGNGTAPPHAEVESTKRVCRACGTEHPAHAAFCRQCGGGL